MNCLSSGYISLAIRLSSNIVSASGRTTYEYYYVQHYIKETDKIEWCYLGRYDKVPLEYKDKLEKNPVHENPSYIQNYTQTTTSRENLNLSLINENKPETTARAGSLARLGHLLDVQKVAGSNPARPTNRD